MQDKDKKPSARIAILMACHNRRDMTLACLDGIHQLDTPDGVSWTVFLVDDGSTDGTAEAVRQQYPNVNILKGDGSLFWAGGMRLAMSESRREEFDYYLWLNDDTKLSSDALKILLSPSDLSGNEKQIIVGTTLDAETFYPTYGGVVRTSRWHPFRYVLVEPGYEPIDCDTMNGNCVLISRAVFDQVGNIDPAFQHGFGDYDYGLRAKRQGYRVLVAPGVVGWCQRIKIRQDWRNAQLTWRKRWAALTGPKGLPPKQMMVYAMRHGGPLWMFFWAVPYVRALLFPLRKPPKRNRPTIQVDMSKA